jgi:hypothetical protein
MRGVRIAWGCMWSCPTLLAHACEKWNCLRGDTYLWKWLECAQRRPTPLCPAELKVAPKVTETFVAEVSFFQRRSIPLEGWHPVPLSSFQCLCENGTDLRCSLWVPSWRRPCPRVQRFGAFKGAALSLVHVKALQWSFEVKLWCRQRGGSADPLSRRIRLEEVDIKPGRPWCRRLRRNTVFWKF